MILFPAIDLKEGACVRLQQGDMARATIFNQDPAAQARAFEQQGFQYLHVVDLDGAFAGKPVNAQAVDAILRAIKIPLQLGGGVRDMATVDGWLGKGVTRVIIGTAAVRDPDFVKAAAKRYPGKIAVGVDARDRMVAVEGWAKQSELTAFELADRFADAGVTAIVYTDISRDGVLAGINWDATYELADHAKIPVIASGGLSNADEIKSAALRGHENVEGIIAGRALYDGRIDAAQALKILKDTAAVSAKHFVPGRDRL
ncbi:MAG: phosphoribosylformimino-5-aminoimidazole carboxamide ribotide isomerase [Alphaproteobacteria bacterium]|nr:phosphoribosylformimino-5-aminoimidazole carboxamide ribotide isomerase [Alphaproteobacteria bacterium]